MSGRRAMRGSEWATRRRGLSTDALPLVRELHGCDAWGVCRRLAALPHLLFLDSALAPSALSRFSFVTADPFRWIVARGRQTWIDGQAYHAADPFMTLARELARYPAETLPGLPPFQGGAAGLFGYDLAHHLERLPQPRHDEFAVPELAIGLYDWVIAFDQMTEQAWLLSTGWPETRPPLRRRRAEDRMADVLRRLSGPETPPAVFPVSEAIPLCVSHPLADHPHVVSNFSRAEYTAAVARAVEYVHAGDCFQVNLAQRLTTPLREAPLELYGRLRARNPAPFAGYFELGDFALVSASPERFVRVADGAVETRPIKGTRPRGATPVEDARHAAELLASTKDRAENVMIIDLLRNDLGRVCAYGSVRVEAVCRLESYATVHHLVSAVRGQLRPGLGPIDLLRATFPGGSVTGAPKIRAMEIIAELEPTSRGPYCGCLGYLGFDGTMDTNILIRTFTAGRGWLQFPVGGGIVADSDPVKEYEETLHKAAGMLRALQ